MKEVVILECPSNLGLHEPAPGIEPGVRKLPAWLRKHHFHDLIPNVNVYTLNAPPYTMNLDKASGVRNADAIVAYAKQQSGLLKKILGDDKFPIVLGGDCSILIGNSLTLKQTGNFGLFFLDGHTDFGWAALSKTGGAAGMDLAIATGYGHEKLTNIDNCKPYIKDELAYCAGNRYFGKVYMNAIEGSNITYIDLPTLRERSIAKVADDFLKLMKLKHADGFWLHIDVDVLDDEIMPAVDSRQAGGLNYQEFTDILLPLLSSPLATGLEITILDPDLDPTGEYTKGFVGVFCDAFNKARKVS